MKPTTQEGYARREHTVQQDLPRQRTVRQDSTAELKDCKHLQETVMRDFSVLEVTLWPIRWVKNAHQATFVHKAQPPLLHVPRELSLMQPGTSQNLIARTALQVIIVSLQVSSRSQESVTQAIIVQEDSLLEIP